MKILIFGRDGQIGRELRALAPGARALGRGDADLSKPHDCYQAAMDFAPDFVINAAAWTNVDAAETNEQMAWRINAEAPGEIARAADALSIPMLHLSTEYVFNGGGNSGFRPDDRPAPLSAYGRGKRAGEAAVRSLCARHIILRTSWVFSAHRSNFVKTMLRSAGTRNDVRVVADQIGGPTPARDIARACLKIAGNCGGKQAGTYHLSGTPDTSRAGFCREIYAMAGLDVRITEVSTTGFPTPAPRPLNCRLNCDETTETFEISRPGWKSGLKDVLADLGYLR